jgi:hypothetical protein
MSDASLKDSPLVKFIAAVLLVAAFGLVTRYLWDWSSPPPPRARVLNDGD